MVKINPYAFNGHFCHYFQRSLVDINFFARTVSYTFLEMFFKPEYSVHGIGCNFWKSKWSPDPTYGHRTVSCNQLNWTMIFTFINIFSHGRKHSSYISVVRDPLERAVSHYYSKWNEPHTRKLKKKKEGNKAKPEVRLLVHHTTYSPSGLIRGGPLCACFFFNLINLPVNATCKIFKYRDNLICIRDVHVYHPLTLWTVQKFNNS